MYIFFNSDRYALDILKCELGVHWDAYDLARSLFAYRKHSI